MPKFLDLFAGAGGLSEGFIREGYTPVAHVEMDGAACYTLKTRTAFHWLNKNNLSNKYKDYLNGKLSRTDLYDLIPNDKLSTIIHAEINESTLQGIFSKIDTCLDGDKLDLIVGGPPCQAYSLVGRSRDKNGMRGDKRNYLFVNYAEFLKRYKPSYFVFENVLGLLSAKDEHGELYFDKMRKLFKKVGYETEYEVLSADEHGVLQNRKRIILIGKRGKTKGFYPTLNKIDSTYTVNEIFSGLPQLKAGEGSMLPFATKQTNSDYLFQSGIRNKAIPITMHVARPHTEQDLEIYRIAVQKWNASQERLNYNDLPDRLKTHKNRKSFTDRFKVVAADLPASHTVVAHISKDGHYYIHPDIKQNRSLTPREAARIQTFPDDYFFESVAEKAGRTAAYKQIGNAVPVLMGQKVAHQLIKGW